MQKIKNIVLLAGGESSRFSPLKNKNLFVFCGATLIEHQIKKLKPYAEHLYLVVNDHIAHAVSSIVTIYGVELLHQKGKGQASALLSGRQLIKGETLVVNIIDVFNEQVLLNAIFQKRDQYRLILTAKEMKEYFPGGYIRHEGDIVRELVEKPHPDQRPSNTVRLVVDYFAEFGEFIEILEKVPNPFRDGAFEEGLNRYIQKTQATFIAYKDYWYFLKYPWHVLSLQQFFLSSVVSHRGKNVHIDESARIEGEVFIGDNVRIHAYSKIVGPCYIGEGSTIGNFVMIRDSMIGKESMIGGYCEVTRSYLGQKVLLHRNYVGDSVLDDEVLLGADAICANFRFDEKAVHSLIKGQKTATGFYKLGVVIGSKSKIGVNSSIMPGVKIHSHSRVFPHSLVSADI